MNGRDYQVTDEQLPDLRSQARLPSEQFLSLTNKHMAHGRRHETPIQGHRRRLLVYLRPGKCMCVEGCIFGHALRGYAGEMRSKHLLAKLQDTCVHTGHWSVLVSAGRRRTSCERLRPQRMRNERACVRGEQRVDLPGMRSRHYGAHGGRARASS